MVGGGRLSHEEMMTYINHTGRDNARTPMQWDDSANGGFSDGVPWIKANPNYREINAAEQMERDTSVYAFYKKLLAMRRSSELIQYGTYRLLLPESPSLFLYEREWEGRHMLVVCNFTAEEQKITISGIWKYKGKLVLDNYGEIGQDWDREPEGPASLRPYEAAVWLEDQ